MVLRHAAVKRRALGHGDAGLHGPGGLQEVAEVQVRHLWIVLQVGLWPQEVCASDDFSDLPDAQGRHDLPCLLGDQEKVVDKVLRLASELLPELWVLRGDADRAGVEVALPHHDAAQRDERGSAHSDLLGAEEHCHHDVSACSHLAVCLQRDAVPETVQHQGLVSLRQADLPGQAAMLDGAPLGCACAPGHAGNGEVVSLALHDAGGNDTDANARHELHRDSRGRVRVLQVHDELSHVLDGVHVVVGRRRDEANARGRVASRRNGSDDLVAREFSSFSRLGALRELDLQLVGIGHVLCGNAEAAGGDLLDLRPH
mmetsp:Transcript_40260/g.88012  ORF Transcript_40260/g.88012 Transcript_40260/m.88012 type:complete len:314 (+) Transcript_40260:361-1302(+)